MALRCSSIPANYSQLTSLTILELGRNSLTGTSSLAFKQWEILSILSIFDNRQLSWDLNLFNYWSKMKKVLMQVFPSAASRLSVC